MKNYLDDLLVWTIIIAVIVPIGFAVFKRKPSFIFIVGMLLLISSVPAGMMLEVSVNFNETRIWGIGYLLMAIMTIAGILIMIFSKKLARK